MRAETPSEVLFDFLKCDLQINNREAARILISDKPMGSKPAPRFRIAEKTFLSRRVVHVVPGTDKIDPEMFADFSQSVQNLAAVVKIGSGSSPAAANARQQAITAHALERMATSLEHWGLDGTILRNIFDHIAVMPGLKQSDRRLLELLALTVCGCLADPNAAASEVKDFAITQLAQTFGTLETAEAVQKQGTNRKVNEPPAKLGLLRLANDGSALPPIYPLSLDPEGTVLGSFARDRNAITNVGPDVSRRHLRVAFSNGTWLASGLHSTNGTVLVTRSGVTTVIEKPRSLRSADDEDKQIPIHDGDLLKLGSSTEFLVLKISSNVRALA